MSDIHIAMQDDLKNSVEIGETSKKELYIKSVKRYFGDSTADMESAIDTMFATYDRVKKAINERRE